MATETMTPKTTEDFAREVTLDAVEARIRRIAAERGDGARVGVTWAQCECPIAEAMKELGYERPIVDRDHIGWVHSAYGGHIWVSTPLPLQVFTEVVDGVQVGDTHVPRIRRSCSAKRALAAVAQVRERFSGDKEGTPDAR